MTEHENNTQKVEMINYPPPKEGTSIVPPPAAEDAAQLQLEDRILQVIQQVVELEERMAGRPLTWGDLQAKNIGGKIKAILAA